MKFNEQNPQPYDWENEGVYVIEPTDPVEGGEEGVSNRQAKELTRRTRNLHTRMTTAEGEIDALQEQTPIQVEAALRSANTYTDGKDTVLRADMAIADTAAINAAKAYADKVVAALVDNSPEALNTLQELAKALGNDPNFATTVMQAIGERMKTADVNAALAGKANASDSIVYRGINANSSIDECQTTGYYFDTRGPSAGTLLVIRAYGNVAHPMQLLIPYGGSGLYTRSFNSDAGRWSPWVMMYHSGNLTPQTIGAMAVGLDSVDPNSIFQSGAHRIFAGPNVPHGAVTGSMLLHMNWDDNAAQQIITGLDSDRMWMRRKIGAVWQPWVEMYHSGNLVAATQAAAGLMSAADKTKLDGMTSGLLAGYRILASGFIFRSYGPKASTNPVGKPRAGHFTIYHNIGDIEYIPIVTAHQTGVDGGGRGVWLASIIDYGINYVTVATSDSTNGVLQDVGFNLILMR